MRGNEQWRPVASQLPEEAFPIPMRGNENDVLQSISGKVRSFRSP